MHVDPKSVKRHWQLDWVLTLWGATGVKAACKYVDEIDPRMPQFPISGSAWMRFSDILYSDGTFIKVLLPLLL